MPLSLSVTEVRLHILTAYFGKLSKHIKTVYFSVHFCAINYYPFILIAREEKPKDMFMIFKFIYRGHTLKKEETSIFPFSGITPLMYPAEI